AGRTSLPQAPNTYRNDSCPSCKLRRNEMWRQLIGLSFNISLKQLRVQPLACCRRHHNLKSLLQNAEATASAQEDSRQRSKNTKFLSGFDAKRNSAGERLRFLNEFRLTSNDAGSRELH
ncbi:MAG: hypothetical protein ND866_07395, partial [Pyrinomonadaceae bacterium]|nr:hypothetical protein [Pyrinomonadaceae bacterium]